MPHPPTARAAGRAVRTRVLAAALALAALLAAGAALVLTDDDRPARDARADARARDRAGALCTRGHDRLAGLPPLNDAEGIATAGPEVVEVTLDTARRLLALEAPAERAATIRVYARRLLRQATLTSRLQRAARAHDRAEVTALIARITANSRAGRAEGAAVSPGCGGIVRPASPGAPEPQAV